MFSKKMVRRKVGEKKILVTSFATNANLIVAEEEAPKMPCDMRIALCIKKLKTLNRKTFFYPKVLLKNQKSNT